MFYEVLPAPVLELVAGYEVVELPLEVQMKVDHQVLLLALRVRLDVH